MLEDAEDGTLRLRVSVSPEYKGNRLDAWGANASFQLAAIHRLTRDLAAAADTLGEPADPRWADVRERLPQATIEAWPGPQTAVIGPPRDYPILALWEGQLLEKSHRHHSHLAALHPFETLDLDDPEWLGMLDDTFKQWTFVGTGLWSGWTMSWAAILHARAGNADMAEALIEWWDQAFNTVGNGQGHDARFAGFSLLDNASIGRINPRKGSPIRLQMDQPMGIVTAILEMLLHEYRGVHQLFLGAPEKWDSLAFSGIHSRGGFVVGARREHGTVVEVTVQAIHGGTFRLKNPWPGEPPPAGRLEAYDVIAIDLEAGATCRLVQ